MTREMRFSAVLVGAVVLASTAGPLAFCERAGAAETARNLPLFEVDSAWPKVPPKWRLGDASSIAIDAQDNVWVLHRPATLKGDQAALAAPPVVVFDAAGNFVKAWGGEASGYEWPQREHGIHIDYKGYVWLGGNNCPANGANTKPVNDDQLLKFTQDGKLVMQIGRSNQSKGNADTVNLHRPADAWVLAKTNEVFVADGYGNRRVVVFDAETGKFKRMWGAFAKKPTDDASCAVRSRKDFSDGEGPDQFNVAHAIRVSNDGMVYLADRENRRVQMFTADGKFVKQLLVAGMPFARDLAFSPDPAQQFLYVGAGKGVMIVDRRTLESVGMIQVPGQIGPGHHIAVDAKGNLYIAQTSAGLQKLVFKGMGASQ